jgi:hypothetical protein
MLMTAVLLALPLTIGLRVTPVADLYSILNEEGRGLTPQGQMLLNQASTECMRLIPEVRVAREYYGKYRAEGYTQHQASEITAKLPGSSWRAVEIAMHIPDDMSMAEADDRVLHGCIHEAAVRASR